MFIYSDREALALQGPTKVRGRLQPLNHKLPLHDNLYYCIHQNALSLGLCRRLVLIGYAYLVPIECLTVMYRGRPANGKHTELPSRKV